MRWFGGSLVGWCTAFLFFALPADASTLYVVNTLSENISVIDTVTDSNVGEIPLGIAGYRITLVPRSSRALITTTTGLVVVDLHSKNIVDRITLELSPLANVHVVPDGSRAIVITAAPPGVRNDRRGQAVWVELATGKVTGTVNLGLNPLDSVMTRDGSRVFVVNWASRDVTVLDAKNAQLLDVIPLGVTSARTLAISPDGSKVYLIQDEPAATTAADTAGERAILSGKGEIPQSAKRLRVIDTANLKMTTVAIAGMSQVYALGVSPGGQRLFVLGRTSSKGGGNVVGSSKFLDEKQNLTEKNPVTEKSPLPERAAATNTFELSVLDTRTFDRIGKYGQRHCSAIAFDAKGTRVYLIGTPGDPVLEAKAHQSVIEYQNAVKEKLGNRPFSPSMVKQMLDMLKPLRKTITVISMETGKVVKLIEIGSLPQGFAWGDVEGNRLKRKDAESPRHEARTHPPPPAGDSFPVACN